jgi:hypothetical protein
MDKKINLEFLHKFPKHLIIEAIQKTFLLSQDRINALYDKIHQIQLEQLHKKYESLSAEAKELFKRVDAKRHDELAKSFNETNDTKKKLEYIKEMNKCFYEPLEVYKECHKKLDEIFAQEEKLWKKLEKK